MACADDDNDGAAVRGTLPMRLTTTTTTTKRIGQQTTTITELNETKRRHTCNSNAYEIY